MKNRKVILLTIVIIFSAIVFLCMRGNSEKEKVSQFRIGADITLTGGISYWGQQIKKGLDLAAIEYNEKNTNAVIEIISQDNRGQVSDAISIFRRFADVDGVSAVVSVFSPMSSPLRKFAGECKLPLISTVVSAEGFGLANEWSFRDFPSQSQQSSTLARYVWDELKVRTAATLVVTDEYGTDGEKVFVESFLKLGGKIFQQEYVDQNAPSVRDQASKIITSSPDCLYIVVRDLTLGKAVRLFRELGYKGYIVGVNAFDSPPVWEAAGKAGEGCVFTSAFVDLANPAAAGFVDNYKKVYSGELPDWIAAYGYTMGSYICDAVIKAQGDRDITRKLLSEVDTESIRGKLYMDSNRDVISPIGIFVRRDGKNVLLGVK